MLCRWNRHWCVCRSVDFCVCVRERGREREMFFSSSFTESFLATVLLLFLSMQTDLQRDTDTHRHTRHRYRPIHTHTCTDRQRTHTHTHTHTHKQHVATVHSNPKWPRTLLKQNKMCCWVVEMLHVGCLSHTECCVNHNVDIHYCHYYLSTHSCLKKMPHSCWHLQIVLGVLCGLKFSNTVTWRCWLLQLSVILCQLQMSLYLCWHS